MTITKSNTSLIPSSITDSENTEAQALLSKITNTWNIVPREITLGPLADDVNQDIVEKVYFKYKNG